MDSGAAIAPSIHRQQRYVNDEYEDENILLQKELFMHALHKGLGPQTEAQNVHVQLVQFYTSKKSSQIVKIKCTVLLFLVYTPCSFKSFSSNFSIYACFTVWQISFPLVEILYYQNNRIFGPFEFSPSKCLFFRKPSTSFSQLRAHHTKENKLQAGLPFAPSLGLLVVCTEGLHRSLFLAQ